LACYTTHWDVSLTTYTVETAPELGASLFMGFERDYLLTLVKVLFYGVVLAVVGR